MILEGLELLLAVFNIIVGEIIANRCITNKIKSTMLFTYTLSVPGAFLIYRVFINRSSKMLCFFYNCLVQDGSKPTLLTF